MRRLLQLHPWVAVREQNNEHVGGYYMFIRPELKALLTHHINKLRTADSGISMVVVRYRPSSEMQTVSFYPCTTRL